MSCKGQRTNNPTLFESDKMDEEHIIVTVKDTPTLQRIESKKIHKNAKGE